VYFDEFLSLLNGRNLTLGKRGTERETERERGTEIRRQRESKEGGGAEERERERSRIFATAIIFWSRSLKI
jgi:hypothetical protein